MRSALLLSGGMDSTAIAFWKRPELAVTIDYGQRPAPAEARAAEAVCRELGIEHLLLRVDLSAFGSGDLSSKPALNLAPRSEWWPYRNQALITIAAMATISRGIGRLIIGTLKTDAHHADGTPEFVSSVGSLLAMQEGAIQLDAPAIDLDAVELIRSSGIPIEILAWSHSCHSSEFACGECGGCRKHYRTMEAIGVDPY